MPWQFCTVQIPPNLLSYDDDASASDAEKLAAVKRHVAAINETINAEKKAEIEAERERHAYAHPGARAHRGAQECEGAAMSDEDVEELESGAPRMRSAGARSGDVYKKKMCAKGAMRSMGGAGPPRPAMAMMAMEGAGPPRPAPVQRSCAPSHPESAPPPDTSKPMPSPSPADSTPAADLGAIVGDGGGDVAGRAEPSYTSLPALIDSRLETYDVDGAVRPSRLDVGDTWTRKARRCCCRWR